VIDNPNPNPLFKNAKTGLTIQIQNPILAKDCQSQSNPPNWIAIWIEKSSNTLWTTPCNLLRVPLAFVKLIIINLKMQNSFIV